MPWFHQQMSMYGLIYKMRDVGSISVCIETAFYWRWCTSIWLVDDTAIKVKTGVPREGDMLTKNKNTLVLVPLYLDTYWSISESRQVRMWSMLWQSGSCLPDIKSTKEATLGVIVCLPTLRTTGFLAVIQWSLEYWMRQTVSTIHWIQPPVLRECFFSRLLKNSWITLKNQLRCLEERQVGK